MKALKTLALDDSGATLVEYSLVIGLVAVVCIVAIHFMTTKVSSLFSTVGNDIKPA